MAAVFLKLLNMSLTASWLALAVIVLRLLLKKAPKAMIVFLWAFVGIRLICPFSWESVLSLIPSSEPVPREILSSQAPAIQSGFPGLNSMMNPILSESLAPEIDHSVNPIQAIVFTASLIWGIGMAAMFIYTIISYLRIYRNVREATPLQDSVWLCDRIDSPFIFGIIYPHIYLPPYMNGQDMNYVIAHEKAHLKRRDYLWKPIGFLLLSVYWFNPILWLAYILLCRDIEFACDERVMREMGTEAKKPYSDALINCSVPRSMIAACPLAFGEVCVKARIQSVLHYKKPAFWIIAAAVIASVAVGGCFLTDPVPDKLKNIEGLTLDSTAEETVAVLVSDGVTYRSIGAVSNDLLQELSEIKISKKEISSVRNEDRDKSHTLVLQRRQDVERTLDSCVNGIQIHFSLDFSAVWVNNDIKPTLSYRVKNPKRAKNIYMYIAYNIRESAVDGADGATNITTLPELEQLKAKYPQYFDLPTFKGLEVYVWQMSENSYSCGLLPGLNRRYTAEELWNLHTAAASTEEMRIIVKSYHLSEREITLIPIRQPHSSYFYTIDENFCQKVKDLFFGRTG